MADDVQRVEGWEVRPVPREDRAPIVEKTLDILQDSESRFRLIDLDAMDLLAVINNEPGGEEVLRGLYWLAPSPVDPDGGVVAMGWIDDIDFNNGAATAYERLRVAIDEWARERNIVRVSYVTRSGFKKAKTAGSLMGFKPSPLREFVREVTPE